MTGAAKRLGRVIALRLADEGVNLVFNYLRSRAAAEGTERALRERGVGVLALQADLCDLQATERLIEAARKEFGHVDILVNNASVFSRSPLAQLSREKEVFDQLFDLQAHLHIRAPFYLGMQLGLEMKNRGWGRIININDRVTAKGQAYPHYGLYLATKYGLYGVSQALAQELKPEVSVNTVAPGMVMAPPEYSREVVERLRRQIPLQRQADPEEIAADVLHLIQSDSKTGSVISTDGGAGVHTY